MSAEVSSPPVCIAKQKQREREALHRWLLYATCGSAIAHILLLGISIKQNTLLPLPQDRLPDFIDLTLITTAENPDPPVSSITEIKESVETPPSTITEPVVAVKPAISNLPHVPASPKTQTENVPQSATIPAKTNANPSADQTVNSEATLESKREHNPFTQEPPTSEKPATSNLPEIASQGSINGTDKPSETEQGTIAKSNPSSLDGFSDRIRNLLRGNSPSSSPEPSALQTNPTPSTAEPAQPQRVQCIRCDKPEYPIEARNRGLQGQARVAVDVDANGNVTNVRIIQSSGHAELDEAAIRQARQWKFTPSASGRQGIGAKVDFQLEGSEYQRQRQRERQIEELARQEQPKPAPVPEVARQEQPKPAPAPTVVRQENRQPAKPAPVPEVARQEKPQPIQPEPAPIPEVTRQELPPKPAVAPSPPVVAQPEPITPQPIEND